MTSKDLCYGCMAEKPDNTKKCPHCDYINGKEQGEHYYLPEGVKLNDRYIVGKVLGHGGFGITYIGFDTKFDTTVAIKEYLPSDISTRALGETTVSTFMGEKYDAYVYGLGRFIDEAKTLAKYNSHQCIVSINDYFNENNTAYIIMEYLDGISLGEYVKRNGGKISLDETLEIMRPILDALREVHKQGMIHRDVSPDNIFITKDKQIKLLDFGAARHAMSEKSKSLSVVLKPGYAPPEQYYTKGKQGPWTDIYAVAATMYKCITGVTPPEAMERMDEDNSASLNDLGSIYDIGVRSALRKALSVRASMRYQSIREFFEAIEPKKEIKEVVEPKIEAKPSEKPASGREQKIPEGQNILVFKKRKSDIDTVRMKKMAVRLFLPLVLVAIVIGVIASNGGIIKKEEANTERTVEPTEIKNEKDEAPPEEDGYEIVLITDGGDIDDKSYNQMAWEGVTEYAEDSLVNSYKYYKPYDNSDTAYIDAIDKAVREGAKVIVTPSFLFGSAVYYAQDIYPNIYFIMLDATPHSPDYSDFRIQSNVYSIFYAEEEAGFLAGYAAVKEGYTKLGYMGGMAVPTIVRYGYGFVQGAEYAALEMGINDMEIKYHYTGDFDNTPNNYAKAKTWYNSGTEIIFVVAGNAFYSVINAAEEVNGKVIGAEFDQSGISETVITSALKELGDSVYMGLNDFYTGTFKGQEIETLDLTVGGIGLEMKNSRFSNFSSADYNAIYDVLAADIGGVRSSIFTYVDVETVTDIPTTVVSVIFEE